MEETFKYTCVKTPFSDEKAANKRAERNPDKAKAVEKTTGAAPRISMSDLRVLAPHIKT